MNSVRGREDLDDRGSNLWKGQAVTFGHCAWMRRTGDVVARKAVATVFCIWCGVGVSSVPGLVEELACQWGTGCICPSVRCVSLVWQPLPAAAFGPRPQSSGAMIDAPAGPRRQPLVHGCESERREGNWSASTWRCPRSELAACACPGSITPRSVAWCAVSDMSWNLGLHLPERFRASGTAS